MRGFCAVVAALGIAGAASAQTPVPYFSDLEADNGGWSGTMDWEWGMPTGFLGSNSSTEPNGGFSGDNVWGTVLGGDHSPGTVSELTQSFDLSGAGAAELSFWEWSDSGGNTFDMAAVLVNGTQEYLSDGNSNDAWRQVTLDLSAYAGMANVDVNFRFSTTTVVERTGWYVDDIAVTPEPSSLMLLTLVGLIRRR